MGKVYITNENGAQAEYSELQARELVRQGLISKRARYWKAGMVDPRPVSELLKDASSEEEESQNDEPGIVERVVSKVSEFFQRFKK
jgi:hypothetical protein